MSNTSGRLTRRSMLASGLAVSGGLLIPAIGAQNLFAASDGGYSTDLLIIGAGPFGLANSAYAQKHGIKHAVVGDPMSFWRDHMPQAMHLRSTCDWSLDPVGNFSIDAYLEQMNKVCADVEPLSRDFYLGYADWMQKGKGLTSKLATVTSINKADNGLVAQLDNGKAVYAKAIIVATGFRDYAYTPENLSAMFPADRQVHSCFSVDFEPFTDKRILIIGGRMAAFEWAAMIREAGAESVHLAYRHDTPLFETSYWSWVNEIVDGMADDPGWYRRLTEEEKKELNHRFWVEGRKKLEPWLAPRIDHPNVHLHPNTNVVGADVRDDGMTVKLDNDESFDADHVVFATGYRMDLQKTPFLPQPMLDELESEQGYPVLDLGFQTNIPGLYMTSLAAARDFGSFMAFSVSARAQATIIGRAVRKQLESAA